MCYSSIPVACCFVVTSVLCGLVGCGSSGPTRSYAEVTGAVKYNGKPVANGEVIFQPESGAPVVAKIGADGNYKLEGVVGQNTVMINNPKPEQPKSASDDIAKNKAAMADYEKAVKSAKIVPDRFSSANSGLKFEVKAGKNKADFDLQ